MVVRKLDRLILVATLLFATLPAVAAKGTTIRGVRNFYKVNDHVFRGAQPTEEGFRTLAEMGVQVVLDLRREDEDHEHSLEAEQRAVEAAGMQYVNIAMKGIVAPEPGQIARAFTILNSGKRVFVHCREGKDRTGAIIACYRIARDRWDHPEAIKEANSFGMHWYEVGLRSYVMTFRPEDLPPAQQPHATGAAQP